MVGILKKTYKGIQIATAAKQIGDALLQKIKELS
jgi:hypothetical protein